ncbi:MAG: NAD(P)-dependent oxidoreductase [Pirellulaceae bacterium]|nr:NAD(P)-dependent oxidoreductase [Pirellulaceae bacterium]
MPGSSMQPPDVRLKIPRPKAAIATPSTEVVKTMGQSLPGVIQDVVQLETLLSEPSEAAIAAMSKLDGDIMLLGAGGKMGPSLARMLLQASRLAGRNRRVIALSRFSSEQVKTQLAESGIETITCDLRVENAVESLPEVKNIIFMTGTKFGTNRQAARTWAMNVLLPARVCQRFRSSRILAFSTGNVYPFVSTHGRGSVESDSLNPVGEYGMSALGRERIFEYHAQELDIPTTIVRLNYAVETRYGVLVDLAQQVLSRQPIDLTMGFANVIWQADANAMAIAALIDASPEPFIINVAGDEIFSVASVCETFAAIFRRPLLLQGDSAETALLNNAERAYHRYGRPRVPLQRIIEWTADWLSRSLPILGKPTHFEIRNGQF